MAGALVLATLLAAEDSGKHGLYGWGIGLQVPVLGVVSGFGTQSDPGVGYSFGGALDYEVSTTTSLRLFVDYSESLAGDASVAFDATTGPATREFDAEYFALTVGLGASYAFRGERRWAPYIGADLGIAFGGYDYNFGQDPDGLRAIDDAQEECNDAQCRSDINDNAQLSYSVGARGGFQFELAPWLQSAAELSVSYVPLERESISNTVEIRNVTGLDEGLLLIRANFIARFGL